MAKKGKRNNKVSAERNTAEVAIEALDKTISDSQMKDSTEPSEVNQEPQLNVEDEDPTVEEAVVETVEASGLEAASQKPNHVSEGPVEAEKVVKVTTHTESPAPLSTEELKESQLLTGSSEPSSEGHLRGELAVVEPVPIKEIDSVAAIESRIEPTKSAESDNHESVIDDYGKASSESIGQQDVTVESEMSIPKTPETELLPKAEEALKQKTSDIENDIKSLNTPPLPPRGPMPSVSTPGTPSVLLTAQSPAATQSPISPALPPRQAKRHAVPPPLHEELKSEEFRKNMTTAGGPPPMPPRTNRNKRLDSAAEINLVVNRFYQTSHHYQRQNEQSREGLEKGQDMLKTSYSNFLDSLPKTAKASTSVEATSDAATGDELDLLEDDERALVEVDWAYWTQVVNDFPSVANDPDKFEEKVTDGIPAQIRGIIWQLIANSKSTEFEDIYVTLLDTESTHEAAIRRDLKRTKFIPSDKVESLFNVMKVYSVYDPDVGYTQGMAFIATPLILNCETEAESFGLLIRLMKSYGLRELFLPDMPGLMLLLYQFDRLFEENSPQLYNHLTRQGVRSSMYATQWFLTFFAYKFPLVFVLRIYDIVFAEGIESILRIAVNLMLKNSEQLLLLNFDKLLDFLKNELFAYYLKDSVRNRSFPNFPKQDAEESEVSSVIKRDLNTDSSDHSEPPNDDDYDINSFVHDAMTDVHVTPISLKRYAAEYEEIHQIEQQKEAQFESLRIKNKQLQQEVRKLEHDYTLLNREHVEIANELIKNRLKIETLLDENNDQKLSILDLKRQLQEEIRKQQLPNPDAVIPNDLREDLDRTIKRNAEVMSSNLKLQDKVSELEKIIETLKTGNTRATSPGSVPFKQPLAGAFSKLFKNDNN